MAKKITMDSVHAFIAGKPFRRENMDVEIDHNGTVYLKLFGNIIAFRSYLDDKVYIKNCGWETNTTKERLNYLLYTLGSDLKITQKKFVWYLGDKPWSGVKTCVNDFTSLTRIKIDNNIVTNNK